MRCPKCSYISFDKVTSCVKCSADVAELAHDLNGTAFKPLGTFYLGSLLPDFAPSSQRDEVAEDLAFAEPPEEDLDISMDAVGDFGEVPDLPGDIDEEDITLAGVDLDDLDSEDLSLDDHEVPDLDMDLSGFEDDTIQEAAAEQPVEDAGLDDVPDFDLGDVDFEEEADLDMAAEETEDEEVAAPHLDLSDIDLSLGEDEPEADASEPEESLELEGLELEDEEPEQDEKKKQENGLSDLPDLEL